MLSAVSRLYQAEVIAELREDLDESQVCSLVEPVVAFIQALAAPIERRPIARAAGAAPPDYYLG